MSEAYQPEIGQLLHGTSFHSFDVPDLLDAALRYISNELERVLWNRMQRQVDNPFDRWATATFETDGLVIYGYSSAPEDDPRPWNLKCGDVEISWYKHSWRGLSVNRPMSNDDIADFLNQAVAILKMCDIDHDYHGKRGEQSFTYNGEEVGESSFQKACREEREANGNAAD